MDIINIDKHILRWAKNMHKITEEPLEGNKGQTTHVEVVYDKVKVEVVDQKDTEQDDSDVTDAVPDETTEPPNIVFKSTFTNVTDVTQQHNFEMERETTGVMTTSVTKGFSRSGTVGITINVPDKVTNITGGFGPEVQVKEVEESRVSHSLKWKVNSTVTVPPKETTIATLVIREIEKKFDFTAKVILQGTVLVRVLDLTSGRFLKVVQNDIGTLLGDVKKTQERGSLYKGLPYIPEEVEISPSNTITPGRVVWPLEGQLNFRFGIQQNVVVEGAKKKTSGGPSFHTPLFNTRTNEDAINYW